MVFRVFHLLWIFVVLVLCGNFLLYFRDSKYVVLYPGTYSKTYSKNSTSDVTPLTLDCQPNVPCEYPDSVDFRIVVITFNRNISLSKLLLSLDSILLDGANASLEIWIDRHRKGSVDKYILEIAKNFKWTLGPTRVFVQAKHVGIYGQWIDTWRPRADSSELCLFLEDDLTVSPFIWRWLKAVDKQYGNRTDISGYSFQCEDIKVGTTWEMLRANNDTVFLYRLMSTWGFAPHPTIWRDFQDWFHSFYNSKYSFFRPYVHGIKRTEFYKGLERNHKADTMWSMWFTKYCDLRNLYTVHYNLNNRYQKKYKCLIVNRMEPGLHFYEKSIENSKYLLSDWQADYITFPNESAKYEYNGKRKPE